MTHLEVRQPWEAPGQTLQATALVHEAYVRLVGSGEEASRGQRWDGRGHFFAAADPMRRILIDRAREKRGGARPRLDIDAIDLATTAAPDDLLALDEALAKLAAGTRLRPGSWGCATSRG
jgi:hypothetical protein